MTIRLTNTAPTIPTVRDFPDHLLPNICLQIAGGGWSAKQTAKALELQAKVNETGKAKFKHITIEKLEA